MITSLIIIIIVVSYLLGSFPSAVIISKYFYKINIYEHGSKNPGATNVLRVLGTKAALGVLFLDVIKGVAAVYLASLLGNSTAVCIQIDWLKVIAAIAVMLGHIFPVFTKFKGGKGVATLTGIVAYLHFPAFIILFLLFVLLLMLFKYVSLGSITAAILLPVIVYYYPNYYDLPLLIFSIIVALAIPISHHKNIKRLLKGEESKTFLFKKKK